MGSILQLGHHNIVLVEGVCEMGGCYNCNTNIIIFMNLIGEWIQIWSESRYECNWRENTNVIGQ